MDAQCALWYVEPDAAQRRSRLLKVEEGNRIAAAVAGEPDRPARPVAGGDAEPFRFAANRTLNPKPRLEERQAQWKYPRLARRADAYKGELLSWDWFVPACPAPGACGAAGPAPVWLMKLGLEGHGTVDIELHPSSVEIVRGSHVLKSATACARAGGRPEREQCQFQVAEQYLKPGQPLRARVVCGDGGCSAKRIELM